MLDDAILMAGTRRDSRSPVMLFLSRPEKRGRLVSPAYRPHRMLAEIKDLPSQLKQETNKGEAFKEEHL
jgi:hypothetical protein